MDISRFIIGGSIGAICLSFLFSKKTSIIVANTESEVEYWIGQIRQCIGKDRVVGFDAEWVGPNPPALIQIATDHFTLLVRLCNIPPNAKLPKLRAFLKDPSILKAGVNVMYDAKRISRGYSMECKGCIDVRSLCGKKKRNVSLAKLSKAYLSLELDKEVNITCSNWEAPVLTSRQIKYAALDAIVGYRLFVHLMKHSNETFSSIKHLLDSNVSNGSRPKRRNIHTHAIRHMWQYESPSGSLQWRDSAPDINLKLERMFLNGESRSRIQVGFIHNTDKPRFMDFDLISMTSTSVNSGNIYKLRRISENDENDSTFQEYVKNLVDHSPKRRNEWLELSLAEMIQVKMEEFAYDWSKVVGWLHFFRLSVIKAPQEDSPVFGVVAHEWGMYGDTPWVRQASGIFFYGHDSNIKVIKHLIIRAPELLMPMHWDHGIPQNQSMHLITSECKLSKLCLHVLEQLEKPENDLEGVLTSKVDGLLLGVTLYPFDDCDPDILKVMEKELGSVSGFSGLLKEICDEMNLDFLLLLSPQNTLFVSEEVADYVITVLSEIYFEFTREELLTKIDSEGCDGWAKVVLRKFVQCIISAYDRIETKGITSFCFEAVAAEKRTLLQRFHPKLDIVYEKSNLYLLGVRTDTKNDGGVYMPYFTLDPECHRGTSWSVPPYWKVSKTEDINRIMIDLGKSVRGLQTIQEFYEHCPPENSSFDSSILHCEGFMFYKQSKVWEMFKLKEAVFYKIHFGYFKKQSETLLSELSSLELRIDDFYPMLRHWRILMSNLEEEMPALFQHLHAMLCETRDLRKGRIWDSLSEKAKAKFHLQTEETQLKIIINSSSKWLEEAHSLFDERIESVRHIKADLKLSFLQMSRKLLMSVAPWKVGWEMRWVQRKIAFCHKLMLLLAKSNNMKEIGKSSSALNIGRFPPVLNT